MPAQPTARELMKAMSLQNNGWNQQKNIGGASDPQDMDPNGD